MAPLRAPARLLVLALVSGAIFFLGPWPCAVLAAGALGLLLRRGLGLGRLLRELRILLWMAALTFVLSCLRLSGGPLVAVEALPGAAHYVVRLLAAFLSGRLFYAATSATELREAAWAAGSLLPRRVGARVALALALVLGFIPRILEEWRQSLEAARARGYRGGMGPGLEILAAFLRRLMLGALDLPEALASRGWYDTSLPARPREAVSPLEVFAALGSALLLATGALGLL